MVTHVQLLERRRLLGRRHGALDSVTLRSNTATGRMISVQILASVLPFGTLHVAIHDLVVEVLGRQVSAAHRRRHLEDAILDRQRSATTRVVDQQAAGRNLLGTWIFGLSPAPRAPRALHPVCPAVVTLRKEMVSVKQHQGVFFLIVCSKRHATDNLPVTVEHCFKQQPLPTFTRNQCSIHGFQKFSRWSCLSACSWVDEHTHFFLDRCKTQHATT